MSIYSRATLGETDNQIIFNDYTGLTDPVYRVLARAPSKWQIRQQDLPVPFESGSSDFLTLLGSSAYVISGKMYPSSENSYDNGLMALRTVASLDIEQDDILSDDGYVPYIWGDAGTSQKQVFMKPLYVQLAETTQQGFVQPFTIYSKVKDPTIFGVTLKAANTGQSNPSQTLGSAQYSFKYPIAYGSTLLSISADCNNIGTLPVYPVTIFVNGPVVNPRITNSATGEYIEVDVTLSSTSDQLNITYDKDTLNINLNGVNVINKLTTASTLFKIHPGTNTITLSGSSINTGAIAQVDFYDGWPLA